MCQTCQDRIDDLFRENIVIVRVSGAFNKCSNLHFRKVPTTVKPGLISLRAKEGSHVIVRVNSPLRWEQAAEEIVWEYLEVLDRPSRIHDSFWITRWFCSKFGGITVAVNSFLLVKQRPNNHAFPFELLITECQFWALVSFELSSLTACGISGCPFENTMRLPVVGGNKKCISRLEV